MRETGRFNISAEPSVGLEPVGRSNPADRMPLKPRDAPERDKPFNGVSLRLNRCMLADGRDAARLEFSVNDHSTRPATACPARREYAGSVGKPRGLVSKKLQCPQNGDSRWNLKRLSID